MCQGNSTTVKLYLTLLGFLSSHTLHIWDDRICLANRLRTNDLYFAESDNQSNSLDIIGYLLIKQVLGNRWDLKHREIAPGCVSSVNEQCPNVICQLGCIHFISGDYS